MEHIKFEIRINKLMRKSEACTTELRKKGRTTGWLAQASDLQLKLAVNGHQLQHNGLTPTALLALQRKVGNRRTQRVLEFYPLHQPAQKRLMRQADVQQAPAGLPCVVTLEPRPTGEELILRFTVSSAALSSAQQNQIATLVQAWVTNGSQDQVRVDGYASVDGPQERNWRLSSDRAEAVKQALITQGLPASHITALAHGESTAFSATAHAPNRAATITFRRNLAPPPPLLGAALGQTPVTAVAPLPADTIQVWQALVQKGDTRGALQAVVWAMEQRGEINRFLLTTQAAPSSHLAVCQTPEAILLNPVSGAFTRSCGCFGPSGRRLPNSRIEIHPDLVSRVSIGSGQPLQQRAEVLHSTLLHEFRHVVQEFEACNAAGGGSGICTDCNDPTEMDAYLSEIEAGYDPRPLRHAWVRVFTNWDYLSANQQTLFQSRKTAAETKINGLFPGIHWPNDAEVQVYRQNCEQLSAQTHLSDTAVRGNCTQPNFST